MLGLSLYEYGRLNGRNDYQDAADVTKTTVINVINRVCNTYCVDNDILLSVMNAHPNEFIGYVMNTNDAKTDRQIQYLIAAQLEEEGYIYDEDTIDEILCALDISC